MTITHQGHQFLNPIWASEIDLKILSYNPDVYWPLEETTGTTALELVNGWNALYSGATPGAGTGPDGKPCPLFDGINDCIVCTTAELIAAWDGNEICVLAWAKVYNAGVWTDGTARQVWRACSQDYTHIQYARRASAANDFQYTHRVDEVGLLRAKGGLSTTAWFHIGVKATGGYAGAYWNGEKLGSPEAHDSWVDALFGACIGAIGVGESAANWSGWIARLALWFGADNLPSDTAIADMATA